MRSIFVLPGARARILCVGILLCVFGLAALAPFAVRAQKAAAAPVPGSAVISGRVTLDDGRPAVGFRVVARHAASGWRQNAAEATTGTDGRYVLTVSSNALLPPILRSIPLFLPGVKRPPATALTVSVENGGLPYIEPPARTVDPAARAGGVVSAVDFVLRLGPRITVRVHDAQTGVPIPGLLVRYGSGMGVSRDVTTDAQGQSQFRVPQTDTWVKVSVPEARQSPLEFAPGSGVGPQADREIKADPGREAAWDLKTYDLRPGHTDGVWRGTVLGVDGRPVAGALVRIVRAGFSQGETKILTDTRGRFSVPLSRLDYSEVGPGEPHWPPTVSAEKGEDRAWITPTPDQTWDGMTLRLVAGRQATLTGRAVSPDGQPVPGVPVAYRVSPGPAYPQNGGVTGPDGRFTIGHLLPGAWYMLTLGGWSQFGGGVQFGTTLAPTQPHQREGAGYTGGELTLKAGEKRDLGRLIVYRADRVVAGRVLMADGRPPVAPVLVLLRGEHAQDFPTLDAQGRFRTVHAVDEPMTLGVYRRDNGGSRTGPGSPDLLAQVTVHAGEKDVRLTVPTLAAPSPPPPSPAPAALPVTAFGPPRLIPQETDLPGFQSFDGLSVSASPDHVTVRDLDNTIIWQGTLAEADGLRLAFTRNHGVLMDRVGHRIWAGAIRNLPELTVDVEPITPAPGGKAGTRGTVTDADGRVLWSGPVFGKSPVLYKPGSVQILGPDALVAWTGPYANGGLNLQSKGQGLPIPKTGSVRLSAVPCRAVLRDGRGETRWSGPVTVLTAPAWFSRQPPNILLPYAASDPSLLCVLFGPDGRRLN